MRFSGVRVVGLLAVVLAGVLLGCGGGTAGSASPAATPTAAPTPTPTPSPPCPDDAALLAAAKAGNHGALPPDTTVTEKRCISGYVLGRLVTTATDPARALWKVEGEQVTLVVLGTGDLCDSPGVQAAPPEVRAAMRC
jgi:hypothetical protein